MGKRALFGLVVSVGIVVAAANGMIQEKRPQADLEPPLGTEVHLVTRARPGETHACHQFTVRDPATLWIYTPCVSEELFRRTAPRAVFVWDEVWSGSA